MALWHIFFLGWRTPSAAVQLTGDGIGDVAQLFLLFLKVLGGCCCGVLIKPIGGFLDGFQELVVLSV